MDARDIVRLLDTARDYVIAADEELRHTRLELEQARGEAAAARSYREALDTIAQGAANDEAVKNLMLRIKALEDDLADIRPLLDIIDECAAKPGGVYRQPYKFNVKSFLFHLGIKRHIDRHGYDPRHQRRIDRQRNERARQRNADDR